MTPSRFPLAVALAAGLFAGFILGWSGRPTAGSPPAAPSAVGKAPAAVTAAADPTADATQAFDAVRAEPATDYQQRLQLARTAAGFDRAGVVAALEREHARHPDDGDRTLPTEALLARFADLDPPAAVLWLAQTYPVDEIASEWLEVTLGTWLSRDEKGALAWGRGLPAGKLHDAINASLLEEMAAFDPAGVATPLAAEAKNSSTNLSAVFSKLARNDLRNACEQASRLPPDNAGGAISGIMEVWAQRDPTQAYAWAAQIPRGPLHDTAVSALYSTWGEEDPAAAAAWLASHGGPDVGKNASNLATAWAKRDVAAARVWSEGLPLQFRPSALMAVIGAWQETDPRAAIEYAMTLPENQRTSAISAVGQWAQTDLAAAVDWMEQRTHDSIHPSVLAEICQTWVAQDPRACAEYLARRTDDPASPEQLMQTLTTWATRSPEEVWQWGQGLPDAKARQAAISAAVIALAGNDPTQAAARFTQVAPEEQPEVAGQVASKWMETDPAAAARWAGSLPPGDAGTTAVQAVAGAWAQYDGNGVAAWLTGQPPGKARDAGIEAALRIYPDGLESAAAVGLAQSMQDADTRTSTLMEVVSNWLNRDHAAAQTWLDQSQDFTPEQRAEVQKAAREEAGTTASEKGFETP